MDTSKYSISLVILENSIYTYDINTRLVLTSFQGYKYRILKPQERSNIFGYTSSTHAQPNTA